MAELLEDTLARAEQVRTELKELLDQLRGELEGVKSATVEAHEAIRDLRTAMREAREEMRQSGKAEARKHLARQMRAAAEILARDS
jgi:predicted  nucleic acid-binding Zn-ribbon protein